MTANEQGICQVKRNRKLDKCHDLRMALCLFESVVLGPHHIYKEVWMPRTGEELLVEKEPGNSQDRHAVALMKDKINVGHVSRELSSTFWHFLSHEGRIICEVTGRRKYRKRYHVESNCIDYR